VGLEGLGLGKEGLEGVAGREGEDKEGQKEGPNLVLAMAPYYGPTWISSRGKRASRV